MLEEISFAVEPGEVAAVIGGTGTGKSSLVNLIPRFYDASGGRVLVNGQDVRDYSLEELRSQIGMVLQTNLLFFRHHPRKPALGQPGGHGGGARLRRAGRAGLRLHPLVPGRL